MSLNRHGLELKLQVTNIIQFFKFSQAILNAVCYSALLIYADLASMLYKSIVKK